MAGSTDDQFDPDPTLSAGEPVDSGEAGQGPAHAHESPGAEFASSDPASSAAAERVSEATEVSEAPEAEAESAGNLLEREGEAAADYLEGLLDIVDADGDIDMDVEGDRAVVSVIGDRLRHLVGPGGAVLDALQELTRLAVARETGERSRLMLDIGGHRARRRAELTEVGTQAAERAAAQGEPVTLNPMTAFERKVVHDAVAAAGQRSESTGVDPERRVVVLPARANGAAARTAPLEEATPDPV